jgi:hypothetical protein
MFQAESISYLTRHAAGFGHCSIYMVYTREVTAPLYSPDPLRHFPLCDAERDYCTMSETFIMHPDESWDSQSLSLSSLSKKRPIFTAIHDLPKFTKYLYSKPFLVWRTYVMEQMPRKSIDRSDYHLMLRELAASRDYHNLCRQHDPDRGSVQRFDFPD